MHSLSEFSIAGASVCSILEREMSSDQLLIVRDIETLASDSAIILGEMWSSTGTGFLRMIRRELCDALMHAAQVVSLGVHLAEEETRGLVIEDSELVSHTLRLYDGSGKRNDP